MYCITRVIENKILTHHYFIVQEHNKTRKLFSTGGVKMRSGTDNIRIEI
jgi:hypothetical protein